MPENVKIGIISDTHDNLEATELAFRLLDREGAKAVLHLGDIISPFVVDIMRRTYQGEIIAVFGNNDGDRLLLQERFLAIGARIFRSPKEFELEGRRIVMMHEPFCVEALASSGEYDLVTYGHLHSPRYERVGRCLVVNPGTASGYLQGTRTLAILSLTAMEGEIKEF